jgi:hypothetical protein
MPSAYYRALATASFLRDELQKERDTRRAMEMCFDKIHKSLNLYKGHFINRLRFHLNRHHTEYLRKVRVCGIKKEEKVDNTEGKRRSLRVAIAGDLSSEVETLKKALEEREMEIEQLCKMLDGQK